jgi:TonB family protein
VGPNGRLVRDPVVTETSGFPELDAAAVKVAKAGRFTPGTENGTALPESCIKFKVKFVIKAE